MERDTRNPRFGKVRLPKLFGSTPVSLHTLQHGPCAMDGSSIVEQLSCVMLQKSSEVVRVGEKRPVGAMAYIPPLVMQEWSAFVASSPPNVEEFSCSRQALKAVSTIVPAMARLTFTISTLACILLRLNQADAAAVQHPKHQGWSASEAWASTSLTLSPSTPTSTSTPSPPSTLATYDFIIVGGEP